MLTGKQQTWLNHLSDTKIVHIQPYNPQVKEAFQTQKQILQSFLGNSITILHKGASAWEISGKGDLDIYIPVTAKKFNDCLEKLIKHFGEPGSHYPLERVRWNTTTEDIETEVFLVNQDASFWQESLIFWDYIESHPEALNKYRLIKETADGKSVREYYRVKIEFYNDILEQLKISKIK